MNNIDDTPMATPEERTERLTRLRQLVVDWPEERLHMNAISEVAKCGTAYCCIGLAGIDPWFREHTAIARFLPIRADGTLDLSEFDQRITFKTFGLTWQDARNLFALNGSCLPEHAISKAEVLANIDRVLANEPAFVYEAITVLGDEDYEEEEDEDEDDEDDY